MMPSVNKLLVSFSIFSIGLILRCLPLSAHDITGCKEDFFEENKGQYSSIALFKAQVNPIFDFYLEKRSFAYILHNEEDIKNLYGNHFGTGESTSAEKIIRSHFVRAEFLNSNEDVFLEGTTPGSAHYNYLIGNDPGKWATKVKKYEGVTYGNLYKGIHVNIYCKNGNVKYDLIIEPGAKPSDIKINYKGATEISYDRSGLQIQTTQGILKEHLPKVYQEINGKIVDIVCTYKLDGTIVSYDFPNGYNPNYALIVDPELLAATYSGSTADNFGVSATFDGKKNIYLGGTVGNQGIDGAYPVTPGAFQRNYGGGNNTPADSQDECTISKFGPDGKNLIYATYLGGGGLERPQSLIVNGNEELYVFGTTSSTDFPMIAGNAYDKTHNGGYDIFVAKLSADGSQLLASTFVGGSGDEGYNMSPGVSASNPTSLHYSYGDNARGEVQLGKDGSVFVASCTKSNNFPVPNGFGNNLAGRQDACVIKLNPDLTTLDWGNYIGGAEDDVAFSLVLDNEDNVYFAGGTKSNNYPVTNGVVGSNFGGVVDGVVSAISNDGRTLLASSYLGTNSFDQAYFVQLDKYEDLYVFGLTKGDYPVQAPAGGTVYSNTGSSQFVHKLTKSLDQTFFSTVFGNGEKTPNISPTAFLVDTCGLIFFSGFGRAAGLSHQDAGNTNNMPITNDAFQATTDGADFYFLILERDAVAINYGTYFGAGEGGGMFNTIEDHVDGGTARFDKDGTVYQSICACRDDQGLPTTEDPYSDRNQSNNCNAYVLKFYINKGVLEADADISAGSGCAPLEVNFTNGSTGAVDYVWDFGDGTPRSTDFQPTHIFTTPGTYKVMLIAIDSSKCIIADTAYVDVKVTELLLEVKGGSICPGGSIELMAESEATEYEWSPAGTLSNPTIQNPIANPQTTTTYTVKASNGTCEVTKEVTVEVLSEIEVEVFGDTICLGGTAQLFANIDANTYNWTPTTGLDNPNIKNPKATPLQTTTYKVEITTNECKGSGEAVVVVLPNPELMVTGDTICPGDTAQLDVSIDADTYFWNPAENLNSSTIKNPKAAPKTTTTYSVEVSVAGCKGNAEGNVVVLDFPEADFEAVPWQAFSDNPSFNFNDISTDADRGIWYFGDGQEQVLIPSGSVNHVYNIENRNDFPIVFTIKLYVENDFGCPDSVTHEVKITTAWSIFLPNVFSPNGDGVNDRFYAFGTGIEEFEMFIYNRWGEMVYKSRDMYEGWSGQVKNKEGDYKTKQDVYVWKVKVKNIFGKTHKYIGHVTLTN